MKTEVTRKLFAVDEFTEWEKPAFSASLTAFPDVAFAVDELPG